MSRSISPKGIVFTAVLAAGLAAVIVAAGVKSAPKGSAAAATGGVPAGQKAVAISKGALATDESVNGSLVLDKVTLVLHRIEGQTTSLTASAAAGKSPSAPTGNGRTGSGTGSGAAGGTGTAQGNIVAVPVAASVAASAAAGSASSQAASNNAVAAFPTTTVACGGGGGAGGGGGGPSTTTPGGPPTTATPTTIPGPPTTPPLVPAVAPAVSTTVPAGPTTTVACGGGSGGGPSTTVARSGSGSGSVAGAGSGAGSFASASAAGATGSASRTTQVITSVLHVGDAVQLGTVLYTVESQPVVAMSGALPAWRTLTTGITDGPDVEQLEKSLKALGYDRDGTMTIDQHFDTNTAAAVKRWQAGYGLSATGKVTLGEVVFLPSITTVSAVSVKVGDSVGDGDGVLSVAAASQQVIINVPTADQAFVVPGLKVGLGSSSNSKTGTVSLVTSATQSGSTVVEAIITPDALIEGVQNGATVKVHITQQHMADVLMVPSEAIASRLDGRYSVQVVDASGVVSWHDITVLGAANGMVAIKGVDGDNAITDTAQVLQPS